MTFALTSIHAPYLGALYSRLSSHRSSKNLIGERRFALLTMRWVRSDHDLWLKFFNMFIGVHCNPAYGTQGQTNNGKAVSSPNDLHVFSKHLKVYVKPLLKNDVYIANKDAIVKWILGEV